ncbi:universal stress protein [Algoriphagus ornithinivorans]|nr:universal stress protein [Algoriphagus ornithinivorans]
MKINAKILLMTDFSEVAGFAFEYTRQLATKLQAKVEVMHILSTPVDWVRLDKDKEKFYPETLNAIANAKSNLSSIVHDLEKQGINAFSSLIYSFGSETVFEHVQNAEPDFVIMGSEGRGAKKPFYLGSTAQKVLRNIKTPILIVKEEPAHKEIKKIAFLSTLEKSQKPVFKKLKKLADLLGAQLDLIFINTPYDFHESAEIDEMFNEMLESDNTTQHFLINSRDAENGVIYYAENNQPDILTLAKTEKSGLTKFFNPSLTENLAKTHNFPILSICLEE